jgi:hypothetical protein
VVSRKKLPALTILPLCFLMSCGGRGLFESLAEGVRQVFCCLFLPKCPFQSTPRTWYASLHFTIVQDS